MIRNKLEIILKKLSKKILYIVKVFLGTAEEEHKYSRRNTSESGQRFELGTPDYKLKSSRLSNLPGSAKFF
jgi:hypothetical protein